MKIDKEQKRIELLEKEIATAKQEVQGWGRRIRELTSELNELRPPLSRTEEDIQEDIRVTRERFQEVSGAGGNEFHLLGLSKKIDVLEEELASVQR